MSKPFNQLTPSEAERLAILAEECAEVTQAVCKILRHGYESFNPTIPQSETNRQGLQRELGDLQHAMNRMTNCGDINYEIIEERRRSKPKSIARYLHHQGDEAKSQPQERSNGHTNEKR